MGTYQEVEFPEDTRNPFGNVPGLKEKTTMVVTCCWPIPNSRPAFECEQDGGWFLWIPFSCGDIVADLLLLDKGIVYMVNSVTCA